MPSLWFEGQCRGSGGRTVDYPGLLHLHDRPLNGPWHHLQVDVIDDGHTQWRKRVALGWKCAAFMVCLTSLYWCKDRCKLYFKMYHGAASGLRGYLKSKKKKKKPWLKKGTNWKWFFVYHTTSKMANEHLFGANKSRCLIPFLLKWAYFCFQKLPSSGLLSSWKKGLIMFVSLLWYPVGFITTCWQLNLAMTRDSRQQPANVEKKTHQDSPETTERRIKNN